MLQRTCLVLILSSLTSIVAGAPLAVCPPMPRVMNEINHDVKSDISGSVGRLGKINVGAVGVKTEVTASTLFGKYPNVDRIITLQTMSSTYCSMLNQSGLSPAEVLSRWEIFQDKVLSLQTEVKESIQIGTDSSTARPVTRRPAVALSGAAKSQQSAPATASSNARFIKTPCGSIKDIQTGLEWYVGEDRNVSWEESREWSQSLAACGRQWRMPKTAELRALFEPASSAGQGYFTGGKYWPAHLSPVFSQIGGGSWVWSDKELKGGRAISFNFNQGVATEYEKDNQEYSTRAFAVRK